MTFKSGPLVKLCFAGAILAGVSTEPVLAQGSPGPRGQLQQYVSQLQNAPDNEALREKIIKLAQTIKPEPAIPEEARRHFVIATTLAKDAKSPADFKSAADEYSKALLVAPWWAEAYWNQAIALQGAEKYDSAKQAIHLYLETNPKADDARAAQDRLYVIEAKEKEKENQAVAQQQTAQPTPKRELQGDDLIASLDGAVYEYVAGRGGMRTTYTIRGHQVYAESWSPSNGEVIYQAEEPYTIEGTKFYVSWNGAIQTCTITVDSIVDSYPPMRGWPQGHTLVFHRIK